MGRKYHKKKRPYKKPKSKKSHKPIKKSFFEKQYEYQIAKNTEVKPSTIIDAGDGVFATRDLEVGDVVCFYDGYKKPATEVTLEESVYTYDLEEREGGKAFALVGHRTPIKMNGNGQLCNDGFMGTIPHVSQIDNLKAWLKHIVEYNVKSTIKQNVILDVKLTACKPIKQGDELFTKYGYGYWFQQSNIKSKYPKISIMQLPIVFLTSEIVKVTNLMTIKQLRYFETNYNKPSSPIYEMLKAMKLC